MKNLLLTFIAALPLALGMGEALAETSAFTNAAGITINDGTAPTKATPYPSAINVAGMTGVISKLTVQLNGLTHTFPDDIDILLVAPDGTQALILSDVGGGTDITSISLSLDDDAPNSLPDATVISSGTYKPTNYGSSETFPAPAPAIGANSALSAFKGMSPTGVWSLYVVDDNNVDFGALASWTLTITTVIPAQAGQLVISEFRVRGPNGANDEFVEIQNATDSAHTVQSTDSSSGYAVAASDGVARFVIPNGTVIPARGHYLGVNTVGYSLPSHPAGNGTTATGNAGFTVDIPDNAGIALFRTSNPVSFTLPNRLDAVGSTSEANTLYKEGAGYPAITPFSIDYSFYRDLLSGVVKDTNNNVADFVFVDTNATSAGAGQRLGAPGPENLSSPVRLRSGPALVRRVVDPGVSSTSPPNRVRDFTSVPANNSTFGTFLLSRQFINFTGGSLTRLRFRVVDLSTFPSPSGVSDLRPITSADGAIVLSGGAAVTVRGTTLEQPPSQPNGGGFNSVFGANTVTLATPLANGAAINVRFLFGIQQTGTFKLGLIPETLPASATGVWIISGSTENSAVEVETVPLSAIVSVNRLPSDVNINYTCSPGVPYQLQRSLNLTTWTDLGPVIPGAGAVQNYVHGGGAAPQKQFYRLKQLP
ncbi:MAG: sorting protein [Akkermansiaceae bacterium]|nr:sorting protein [Akkermansiaceae bacterium]